jgi:hypothetical protein
MWSGIWKRFHLFTIRELARLTNGVWNSLSVVTWVDF